MKIEEMYIVQVECRFQSVHKHATQSHAVIHTVALPPPNIPPALKVHQLTHTEPDTNN
jgi:hypothetical protein